MQTDELLYIITTKAQRAHTYSQIYGFFFFLKTYMVLKLGIFYHQKERAYPKQI